MIKTMKTLDYEILLQIDKETGEIVERYDSIKAAAFYNEGYKYQSINNAIYARRPYKGYYWRWTTLNKEN